MFLPKKSKILVNLVKQSSLVEEAAQTFKKITFDWNQLEEGRAALEKMEREADEQVHAITDDIEKIFILPFDKEDIKELTDSLDDVVDNLEQAVNRFNIYKISKSDKGLMDFSTLILQSVQQICEGISIISEHKMHSKELPFVIKKIHDLENQGDELHRTVLSILMDDSAGYGKKDILSIIKLKEIFDVLEDTLDKCEDIAVLFEKFRIKYR